VVWWFGSEAIGVWGWPKFPVDFAPKTVYNIHMNVSAICVITGQVIPTERVEALISLGVPPTRWTVVEASQEKRKKAVAITENWDIMVVDSVGEDFHETAKS